MKKIILIFMLSILTLSFTFCSDKNFKISSSNKIKIEQIKTMQQEKTNVIKFVNNKIIYHKGEANLEAEPWQWYIYNINTNESQLIGYSNPFINDALREISLINTESIKEFYPLLKDNIKDIRISKYNDMAEKTIDNAENFINSKDALYMLKYNYKNDVEESIIKKIDKNGNTNFEIKNEMNTETNFGKSFLEISLDKNNGTINAICIEKDKKNTNIFFQRFDEKGVLLHQKELKNSNFENINYITGTVYNQIYFAENYNFIIFQYVDNKSNEIIDIYTNDGDYYKKIDLNINDLKYIKSEKDNLVLYNNESIIKYDGLNNTFISYDLNLNLDINEDKLNILGNEKEEFIIIVYKNNDSLMYKLNLY